MNLTNVEEAASSPAKAGSLNIGDPAPPLAISQCLIGEINSDTEAKVRVVEFWATWCAPCVANMAHLSALQRQYADHVEIIGVTAEDQETVETFLLRMNDRNQRWQDVIAHTIALDDQHATSADYLAPSGATGLPASYVIGKEGKIEWMGHPSELGEVLRAVVNGSWDREAFAQQLLADRQSKEQIAAARITIEAAAKKQDWDTVFSEISTLIERYPAKPELMMQKAAYLRMAGRNREAARTMEQIVEAYWDDPKRLAMVASNVVANLLPGDLTLAEKAAKRACELEPDGQVEFWSVLARVQEEQENFDAAVASQRHALSLDPQSQSQRKRLAELEALAK